MSKDIQVWGSPACSWCKKAIDLLKNQSFDFEYNDALEDPLKFQTLFPEATTVPQIIFRGKHVGGYEGLCREFEDQNVFLGGHSIV